MFLIRLFPLVCIYKYSKEVGSHLRRSVNKGPKLKGEQAISQSILCNKETLLLNQLLGHIYHTNFERRGHKDR